MFLIQKDNQKIKFSSGNIQYSKNNAAILTFDIVQTDLSFNTLKKYKDFIKVKNKKTDEVIFSGRVINNSTRMEQSGLFNNSIICESELNYLNDIKTLKASYFPMEVPEGIKGTSFGNIDTKTLLAKLLDNYNSKVNEDFKKIYLGNITFNQKLIGKTNRESTLSAIKNIILNNQDGYLVIRNEKNKLYLDFLKESPVQNSVDIELGKNLNDFSLDDSNINIFTRIIPLGKDGLNITTVNDGLDYIDNKDLISKYGVIETVMQWNEITIAQNLKDKAMSEFNKMNFSLKSNLQALDLSYINSSIEDLRLYRSVNIINKYLKYTDTTEIIGITLDLINTWKSTFSLNEGEKSILNIVNEVEQMVNTNNIEIVSIGSELITKVSNSEFETYRTQSANEIQETVKDINSNIESTTTELSNEISNKISSADMSSELKQQLNEFDFTIGGNTPLKITQEELDCKFKDGTEAVIGEDGFYYKSGDGKYSYHCLYYHDSITKVPSGESRTITVPEIFRGKDYKIAYWLGNVFSQNATDCINSYDVELLSNDKDNLTFTIKVSIMSFNPRTETSPFWRGYGNIVYTILA
ncbi:MAG: phage tail protein [Sarcina sp.]